MRTFFSTREIAEILGTDEWRVRRLYEAGVVAEPARFAGKRVIPGSDIPLIIDGMRRRGWMGCPQTDTSKSSGGVPLGCTPTN